MSKNPPPVDYKDPKACSEEKAIHDQCFHAWMREKFIPGIATKDDCAEEWKTYELCLEKKLAALELGHLMRKRGIQKPIDISVELTEEPQNL